MLIAFRHIPKEDANASDGADELGGGAFGDFPTKYFDGFSRAIKTNFNKAVFGKCGFNFHEDGIAQAVFANMEVGLKSLRNAA